MPAPAGNKRKATVQKAASGTLPGFDPLSALPDGNGNGADPGHGSNIPVKFAG